MRGLKKGGNLAYNKISRILPEGDTGAKRKNVRRAGKREQPFPAGRKPSPNGVLIDPGRAF